MENRTVSTGIDPRFSFKSKAGAGEILESWNGDIGFGGGSDRRYAFSRQSSFRRPDAGTPISVISDEPVRPSLYRSSSRISIPPEMYPLLEGENVWKGYEESSLRKGSNSPKKGSFLMQMLSVIQILRSGSRSMKQLSVMITLNVAYSTIELIVGIFTGRVGLVSDAFHLTFGCGLLTFSLFAMGASRKKPDGVYTYGYKRLEVLAAFTNALFLLFMSFSIAVEALHAFIQDESEHKHYLIVSAVTNLLVNLIGVWFFRSYARINLAVCFRILLRGGSTRYLVEPAMMRYKDLLHSAVYRKAEDMNYHSVCLHVLADSIRSAGLILASWFLSLGVKNAEVLCMGLVSVVVFMVVIPLFRATGGILLQMAPPSIPPSAFSKCWRQITALEDVSDISQARFWELVPGHVVGSLFIQVKKGADDHPILQHVHGLYHDLGIRELTVQTDFV